jgi:RND family efflux transporter MFP subunit
MRNRSILYVASAAAVIAAVVTIGVLGVGGTENGAQPVSDGYAGPVAVATARNVSAVHSVDAAIESVSQAVLSAQTAGTITAINVDAGDRVKRGQLLVAIDTREADAQLQASRAGVAQAEARLAQAKQNFERTQSLVNSNFVSRALLDTAAADYDAARAALQAARAGTSQATTARSFAELRSPIDGVVTRRLAEAGELATPGRPLIELHDPARLRAVGTIPQYLLAKLSKSSTASVQLDDGRTLAIERLTILPAADPRLLATQVRGELAAGSANGLVPGISVKLLIPIGTEQRLVIPESAVIHRGEVVAVRVVTAAGRLQLRQVRLGRSLPEGEVEILAGLDDGERVALPTAAQAGGS